MSLTYGFSNEKNVFVKPATKGKNGGDRLLEKMKTLRDPTIVNVY